VDDGSRGVHDDERVRQQEEFSFRRSDASDPFSFLEVGACG